MVKYYESNTIFQFKWDQVAQAFWCRYPNPNSAHVVSEDTISREIKDGKLHSKRLLTKIGSIVPKWGEKFLNSKYVKLLVVEESVVDPKEKILTTYTRNLGYIKVMVSYQLFNIPIYYLVINLLFFAECCGKSRLQNF